MPDPSTPQETERRELTKALILEIELPQMYVEDIPGAIAEMGPPSESGPPGEAILSCIGEPTFGSLTTPITGEKCGDIVTTPFLVLDARIEDRPPREPEWLDDAVADLAYEGLPSDLEIYMDEDGIARMPHDEFRKLIAARDELERIRAERKTADAE
jgi:hypothetical protein